MKKILALALALMLCLCSVAFADGEVATTPTYTDQSTVTFVKTYNIAGTTGVSPQETFSFGEIAFVSATDTGVDYTEAWAKANLPSISTVTFAKGAAGNTTDNANVGTFTITLPTNYPSVGIYTYSFKEVDNGYEGVTYNSTTMNLVVTVVEEGGFKRIAAVHCEGTSGSKTDDFTNTYTAGSLAVTKDVQGNLGDHSKEFAMKVVFTASEGDTVYSDITYASSDANEETGTIAGGWTSKEVTFTLNHGETITFQNIPDGVTYAVTETDSADYTVAYDNAQNGTITNAAVSTVVTNTKGATVDTGIAMDSAPYMIVLALVVVAGVMMMKKRSYNA